MYRSKDRVRVMVITGAFRIEGEMHVLVGSRITDALNSKTKDFLALTDARVFSIDGAQPLYSPELTPRSISDLLRTASSIEMRP